MATLSIERDLSTEILLDEVNEFAGKDNNERIILH